MSQEIINTGRLPNDGLGDPVRVAFSKINNNFINLNSIAGGNLATVSITDPMRTVFSKINDNFSTIFTSVATSLATLESGNQSSSGNVTNVNQMVVNYPSLNQEIINTGLLPNDGAGDSLRTAFKKINNNFSSIFSIVGPSLTPIVVQTEPVIIEPIVEPVVDPVQTQNILNIGQFIINSTQIINSTPFLGTSPISFSYAAASPVGSQEWINIGEQPNDGTGDPLRTAFYKINNNFSNLFATSTLTSSEYTSGLDTNQVIFEYPANVFTQGMFQIRSSDQGTSDSQDIIISAQITNNNAGVKFTGYGLTVEGNAVSRYDMDVAGGNIRILSNPLVDAYVLHFISYQVTFIGESLPGVDIGLDGFIDSVLGAENNDIITTESP
jgi:hypothetical protein